MDGLFHVWFATKRRQDVLQDEVRTAAQRHFSNITREAGIRIIEAEFIADHAHLLIEITGDQTLSGIMHRLKGASARYSFLEFPELRLDMQSNSFWQKGYGWRKIQPKELHKIRSYIRTQDKRPLRHND